MKNEIKHHIKTHYPDYSIWIDEENKFLSIRKIFHREVIIPGKLIYDLAYVSRIAFDDIYLNIERATIPGTHDSFMFSVTVAIK